MADTDPAREALFWTTLLEASLFFSLPAWMLVSRGAWPANDPYRFGLVVFFGATVALILCHVVPALCARRIPGIAHSRLGRLALWPIAAWLCAGAAVSLGQVSQVAGWFLTTWVEDPARREPAVVAATVIFATVSAALAWASPRMQRILTALCGALGVAVLAGLLAWQRKGLWMQNPQMTSEESLDYLPSVLDGVLTVAVPAFLLAVRIGRLGVSTRRIWWSGLIGVWAPLAASTLACSLAMMAGVRLHWKPSLPIDFTWAIVGPQDPRLLQAAWTLIALTSLAPAVVCAMWIRDFTQAWRWKWKGAVFAAALAVLALRFGLTDHRFDTVYWPSWCDSVLVGACLLGLLCLVFRRSLRQQNTQ